MWAQVNEQVTKLHTTKNNIIFTAQNVLFKKGPGLLIDIHQQAKAVYPKAFVGVNLIVGKIINDDLKYNFNINLNPADDVYYSPYKSYIQREQGRCVSERNQAGCSNVVYEYDASKELKCTFLGHIQHVDKGTVECIMDYYGKNFTTSASIANVNVSSTEILLQHLQELNKKLALGVELGTKVNNNMKPISHSVSIVGRYYESSLDSIISGTLNERGLQMCLYKRVKSQFKFATILDVCFQRRSIVGSVACELVERDVRVRSSVDSKGCVVLNVSKNEPYVHNRIVVQPTISALCNLQKQFKLGIGLEFFI